MADKQQSGKEHGAKPAEKKAGPAEQLPEWETQELAAEAWQRAKDRPELLRPPEVLALQRSAGNQAVQQLLTRPAQLVQLHGESGSLPVPSTPSGLSATPGSQVGALPARVRRAHQRHVAAGNMRGALDAVVDHMVADGQIDRALLRTEANADHRMSECHGSDCFILENVPGAFTYRCNPIAEGTTNLPNPRIKINPNTIRNLTELHSALLHEYRHILQDFAEVNQSGSAVGGPSDCLDCNDPREVDASLAEVEQGYDTVAMVSAFSRVYARWSYLAPEQQAVFQARRDAAEAKITRQYGGTAVDWENYPLVTQYRRFAEGLVSAHEGRSGLSRPFYCSRPFAPTNPGRTSGTPRAAAGGGSR